MKTVEQKGKAECVKHKPTTLIHVCDKGSQQQLSVLCLALEFTPLFTQLCWWHRGGLACLEKERIND